ncbi:uncharacterized protein [Panulirus ornatus]|uniref:uncharacterized protein n=1 Tax=Panulirus ornatus TaxID=150431 RepID=UPI003A8AD47F
MHAQRCPMAKLRAATQQNSEALNQVTKHRNGKSSGILPSMVKGLKEGKKKNKITLCQRSHSAKSQDRPSFFQKLHGDVAPLMPPRPQMYSDETWRPTQPNPLTRQVCYNEAAHRLLMTKPEDKPLIYNENCAVHGRNRSRHYVLPKSVSCPSSAGPQTRQSVDVERLKNWRRNSLTFIATNHRSSDAASRVHSGNINRQRSVSSGQVLRGLSTRLSDNIRPKSQTSAYLSSSLSSGTPSSTSLGKSNDSAAYEDLHNRRSQFRRAWSLFSIGCDEIEKEKPPPQRILRPPTRHVYRRGISGLPIECTSRHLGIAF